MGHYSSVGNGRPSNRSVWPCTPFPQTDSSGGGGGVKLSKTARCKLNDRGMASTPGGAVPTFMGILVGYIGIDVNSLPDAIGRFENEKKENG
jgi:hypothetical protein